MKTWKCTIYRQLSSRDTRLPVCLVRSKWDGNWSRDSSYLTPASWQLFLLPIFHQPRRDKMASVHPGRFSLYEVLLAGPPTPLLHISFVNDFSFPALSLVNDGHARSSVYSLHFAIITTSIFFEADQVKRGAPRSWGTVESGRCIAADVRVIPRRDVLIGWKWWRTVTTLDMTLHASFSLAKNKGLFFVERNSRRISPSSLSPLSFESSCMFFLWPASASLRSHCPSPLSSAEGSDPVFMQFPS